MSASRKIELVYDTDCPVCNNFSQMVRIRASLGELTLISARDDHPLVNELVAQGYDLDEGIVLKIGGNIYHGAEAMHVIAMLGGRSTLFSRFNYFVFKSKAFARVLYPVLKAGRTMLLLLLNRKKIGASA